MSRRIKPLFDKNELQKKQDRSVAQDYLRLQTIFNLFLQSDYRLMFEYIKVYGEFEYFRDIVKYMQDAIKNDVIERGYYSMMLAEFFKRVEIYNDYLIFNSHGEKD